MFPVLGVIPPNMFDRLQTASFLGGHNASIIGNMPAMSHYVTSGLDPFVAVYTAVEVGMCVIHVILLLDYSHKKIKFYGPFTELRHFVIFQVLIWNDPNFQ